MTPLPTALRALYQRIATGRSSAMAALEALMARSDVTWETPLHSGVYTMLDAICRHPDAAMRQDLLRRFEEVHPAGHPVWAKQVFSALYADWETVQRFHRCGAVLATCDSDGRSLATHAVLRNDSAAGVACFHALRQAEPSCATTEVMEVSWVAALNGCRSVFIAEFLKLGCSPDRPIWNPRTQSHCGSLPATLLLNYWRSFGGIEGTPEIRAGMKSLDDYGVNWRLAQSAAGNMVNWGLWDTFQRWQVEWAQERARERAENLDERLPLAKSRPPPSFPRM